MTEHELKTHPEPFQATLGRRKLFEIRSTVDRTFNVGDVLILEEWSPEKKKYSGRSIRAEVTYLAPGGSWGLPSDLCVMGIEPFHFQAKP